MVKSLRSILGIFAMTVLSSPVIAYEPIALPTICTVDNSATVKKSYSNSLEQLKGGIEKSTRADGMYPVNVTINSVSNYSPIIVCAVRTVNSQIEVYGAQPKNGVVDLQIPEGTWDFLCLFSINSGDGMGFVSQNNVAFAEGGEVTFDASTATHRTDLTFISPSGTNLVTENTQKSCMFYCGATYKGSVIVTVPYISTSEGQTFVMSNNPDSDFSLARSDFRPSATDGMVFLNFNVDLKQDKLVVGQGDWAKTEFNIRNTPVKSRFEELFQMMGATDEDLYYWTSWIVSMGNKPRANNGRGIEGVCASDKYAVWSSPEAIFSCSFYPCGSTLTGPQSSIVANIVRVNEDKEFEYLGLNTNFGENDNMYTPTEITLGGGNTMFQTIHKPSTELGNSAPAVTVRAKGRTPDINFIGRYGEAYNIDAMKMTDFFEPEFIEFMGVDVNSVKVYMDGSLIIDKREDYPLGVDWTQDKTYKVEFDTTDILIDGETPGKSGLALTFNPTKHGQKLPSVTSLRFTDGQGNITDKLPAADGSKLEMYVADASFNIDAVSGIFWTELTQVAGVEAKVAPAGTEDYETLTITGVASKDFWRCYGEYVEAELNSITNPSASGWYDLYVKVTDENGSVSEQTISPAFHLDTISGIGSIIEDSNVTLTDSAEYYNMQGIKVTAPASGQPVIRRQGNKVTKIMK